MTKSRTPVLQTQQKILCRWVTLFEAIRIQPYFLVRIRWSCYNILMRGSHLFPSERMNRVRSLRRGPLLSVCHPRLNFPPRLSPIAAVLQWVRSTNLSESSIRCCSLSVFTIQISWCAIFVQMINLLLSFSSFGTLIFVRLWEVE